MAGRAVSPCRQCRSPRQEQVAEKSISLSLRTIERDVALPRWGLEMLARATLRFETPPDRQLQIDFRERRAVIGGASVTGLPVCRHARLLAPLYVRAFRNERKES